MGPGTTVYVSQGVWYGLRNTGESTLSMSAIYGLDQQDGSGGRFDVRPKVLL